MKKLLLLFLLLPFSMFAKFYDGTITLNDGSTKTGLIEIPEAGKQNLKFKTDLKAKAETISINDVKGFDVTDGKNSIPTKFVSIYFAKGPLFGDCKVDKKKSWVRIEQEGRITLYSNYIGYRPAIRGSNGSIGASGWPPMTLFYLGRPGINYATQFWMYIQSGGGNVAINNFKVIKRLTKVHFENNCPTLESFIDKEDFKANGIGRIVDLYDEHCGTK